MKCQRCIEGKEARYRVYSDVIDMKVCSNCAAEALGLRLTVELLYPNEPRKGADKEGSPNSGSGMLFFVDSSAT